MAVEAERIEQETLHEVVLYENFRVTPQGLVVTGDPSFEKWEALWETLRTFERTIQFAIGDAAKHIRKRFGERADQIISAATGWSSETIRNYEWASEKVPQEVRRMDVLSFSHHQAVASAPPREQKKWLDRAAEGDGDGQPWPVSKLKSAIKSNAVNQDDFEFVLVAVFADAAARDRAKSDLEAKGARCKVSDRSKKGGDA